MSFRFSSFKVATDANPYTLTVNDDQYIAQDGQTITLPSVGSVKGRLFLIKLGETFSSGVTINPQGGETIEGNTSYSLKSDYDFVELVSNGTLWLVTKESTSRVPVSTKTANYTLALSDEGGLIEMNSAGALTLTIPTNATSAFPVGSQVVVVRKGAGDVTVAGAVGVTLQSVSSNTKVASQYGGATLVKVATDTWYLFGDLSA